MPGTVPYAGGSRDNRSAPILMNLSLMAGSEEEFLLLEIWCLQTHSRSIQGSDKPGKGCRGSRKLRSERTRRWRLSVGRGQAR